MINFSDCNIVKVKSFLGFKSIDPPVPCDEFIQNNLSDLKSLIEKKRLIGLDDKGNEVDSVLLKKYMLDSYDNLLMKVDMEETDLTEKKNDLENYQGELDRLIEIEAEEKGKMEHKQRLLSSLEGCDEVYRETLVRGLERHDQRIESLQDERKNLLARINQRTETETV